MDGVEQRLKYIDKTKDLIKESIVNNGGTITDETPFDEYYTQIQGIVDSTVISQGVVDDLNSLLININGEEV